ncbi:alpha-D-mannose-specific plant lectins domain-containing protein [Dioscorea alata]|uniref:Alpha-D-mannose-specific plant lectins domain-containing protein n=2 Tax=Dioscorea alata TaxID=55571 RepID=A0ACB7VC49_DIOAL|nr:alpha-D-mannose-specific plant lectins domain-containing protein [Dioscorea alata]KAH7671188.1 alpha-D-mannose-specific plant lectins domain-containing protein [Dioscorea alata]
MAHHHLLPFLALILVILPSSSHADEQTSALFSVGNSFLISGRNLTSGIYTLSLAHNCSLTYYENGNLTKDYKTSIKEATDCILTVTHHGQLSLQTGDEVHRLLLGTASDFGMYAVLFTNEGPYVCGPRIWDNGIPRPNPQTLKSKNLRVTNSTNALYSPERVTGHANGDTLIATNEDVGLFITRYCELYVNNTETRKNIWKSNSTSAEKLDCYLYLTERGVLPLQYVESNELITQWTGGAFKQVNNYVLVLRYYGGLDIYGYKVKVSKIPAYSGSDAGNIKMVTA